MSNTLFDKVWDSHVVKKIKNGPDVLFIDRHLVHEVTSPVAFLGLNNRKLNVLFPEKTFATADHNTPTKNQNLPIKDPLSAKQLQTLKINAKKHKIPYWGLGHKRNGIVHVIGPENGITLPGATIVCGDSHTSTHGAFGAIAFGIGTSEVEMVLSTQCVLQPKPKKMRITINGVLKEYVTPKGIIAPDQKTIDYVKGKEYAPKGDEFLKLSKYWIGLRTEKDALFDKEFFFDGNQIEPMITYGTNPGMGISISDEIPYSTDLNVNKETFEKSLKYMNYKEGDNLIGKKIDFVFLGSCTNGRIEDFREFANFVKDKKKSPNVTAWLVPGSHKVHNEIVKEGIFDILIKSGFEIREPGCSACLAMNEDKIPNGKYVVSTSNRNFEGRQGPGARTLLASPIVAAAAAITGKITDPRKI